MNTYHIHITGIVQGVGFRPFVYNKAKAVGLSGWVNNSLDGVHIEFNAKETPALQFCEDIINSAPRLARISSHQMEQKPHIAYETFEIIESDPKGLADIPITPDFALCDDCRGELHQSNNRRFNYPFTTCTNCGPRYSIIEKLPYVRRSIMNRLIVGTSRKPTHV